MRFYFSFFIVMMILCSGQNIDTLMIVPKTSLVDSVIVSKKTNEIGDVVIMASKPFSKSESPIPIELYTAKFFEKNPTPSVFEAIAMVNGIRPQLNCSVCNTGDIHINGLEGAYTMILIDGMPIVSALSTVYGLTGIPNSLIDRIEVVKGPSSSQYGSEAMGGVINIITKNVVTAPKINVDVMTNAWLEHNIDFSTKFNLGEKAASLLSFNYFKFGNRVDHNNDQFTDATLQDRISVFNKWDFKRKNYRKASFALRYLYEDRFGGEVDWQKEHRGGDQIYGESIYTNRFELLGLYQWPMQESIFTQLSFNYHHQDSYYGQNKFDALQKVFFTQTYWERAFGGHQIMAGASIKHTFYDDNTPGTFSRLTNKNEPMKSPVLGFFIQDQWEINAANTLLLGYRYDYHDVHQSIQSPRLAWKLSVNPQHVFRLSFGTGFRVVNVFTEDHAALTGSREVIIKEGLKPEKSINTQFNYVLKLPLSDRMFTVDASLFYTRFSNKIIGDFETDTSKIIYDNLKGYGVSKGISVNVDYSFSFPLSFTIGGTFMEVYQMTNQQKIQQLHTSKLSGTYSLSYQFARDLRLDFNGQFYGPMRLPVFENDYRSEFSPLYNLSNIQVSKKFSSGLEIYGGFKNIFNFLPQSPIMRAFDPFDQQVNDPVNNPNNYSFDTTYGYASLQGLRGFLGVKFILK